MPQLQLHCLSLLLLISLSIQAAYAQCSAPATVDRDKIVRIHNKVRSEIAHGRFLVRKRSLPAAANMMAVHYDCGLEASAQRAADMCLYRHTNAIPSGTGENIMFMRNTDGVDLEGTEEIAMRMWIDEFDKFGFPRNFFDKDLLDSGTLHAYQMAWAVTTRVGCGAQICDRGKMALIFCHYKEQGPFNKRTTYIEGAGCTECPLKSKCNRTTMLCH